MANIIKKKSDPIDSYHHEAGKGSIPRPVNREAYEQNWDRIFGQKSQPKTDGKEQQHANTQG